ncbi:HK97 gp10 family phage protein [Intestinibacillus massiliensis]|nr:HK97 gp10 family phage protein [Intestinibacillus massiliensis]
MMRWGNCEYQQLKKLRDNLQRLQDADLDTFCREASKELAARLLALVIPRTPVGRYPKESGKKGGTLRRGWTARTEQEAAGGGKTDPAAYANALPVFRRGRNFYIEVINPVSYASYVEFGHRTRGGGGWVAGQYFLTLSEKDLERLAPAVVEKKLEKLLRGAFNV